MKTALVLNTFSRIKYFLLLILWVVFFILGKYLPFIDGMSFKETCEDIINNNLDVPARGFADFIIPNWNILEYISIGIIVFGIFMSFTCVGNIKSIEPKKGVLYFIGIVKVVTGSIISGLGIIFNVKDICYGQYRDYSYQPNYNPQGYNQSLNQNMPMNPNQGNLSLNQNQIQNNPNRWQPTGLVPQQIYNYPRPTRLLYVDIACLLGIIISLWSIIFPILILFMHKGMQKDACFVKRADKIVKRGMTYDEVIYIMEGYTPFESYFSHNGYYVLKYMTGKKKSDYEQRNFYFDSRGILFDIGVAYHRTTTYYH